MPKITLENGTSLEISQESYNELQKATQKDWRDAFIEHGHYVDMEKVTYSMAFALKIVECGSCVSQRVLMRYVLSFSDGGFWYGRDGLYFVISGYGAHADATYKHAKDFIKKSIFKHQ